MTFTKDSARRWMRRNLEDHRDDVGEINATTLAEACADAFDANGLGGCLDDPDHWIWDLAIQVGQ